MQDEYETWLKKALQERKKETSGELETQSKEGINLKALYCEKDLKERNYQESMPGFAPFTRGARASMYTGKAWTIRQYAGFSSAKESNEFYKKNLAQGQKGLSVAFDLPTHRGYDSDHERARVDVGKAGVAIDSVEDMHELFDSIALDKVSVSMTMNGAVLPILASFIVVAEEKGIAQEKLEGTIQNDILKEYMVRNTYIYPPKASMRIVADIISYTAKHMPRYNSISISGYHLQEAGADASLELAYTLADGLEYVKTARQSGLDIDSFAPRLSFFFGIGMNFFMEIAKLRAARTLWHELLLPFKPKDPRSLCLRTHCQTSGYSLSEQEPHNNLIRTTIEALAATLGGTQSLHSNAFDEAIALPSDFSARLARNTQLILQEETDLLKTVDPFGGSYFMESLTHDLLVKTRQHLAEISKLGGMTKAILNGVPKRRIEEAAAQKQARIERGLDVIVGVNKYKQENRSNEEKSPHERVTVREVDQQRVCAEQIKKLKDLKEKRDQAKVSAALKELETIAKQPSSKTNLLEASIKAIRLRATVGEVSESLSKVFGRYAVHSQRVQAVYGEIMKEDPQFNKACQQIKSFQKKYGRPPRLLIAKLGQDGHDRGAHMVASGFADMGFDVDIGPLFQSAKEVARQASENDVHLVGISSQAAAHKTSVSELIAELKKIEAENIKVVVGGVIPRQDYAFLENCGVLAIFGPGSPVSDCAITILERLEKSLDERS